jgi:hypothetical protein
MKAPRRLIARDEGLLRLHLIDTEAAVPVLWSVAVPAGRDLHDLGAGRLLLGTERGYQIRSAADASLLVEETGFPGTLAAQPLANGNFLLTGHAWQGLEGIGLVEIDASGAVQRRVHYPGFDYVRLVRPTARGTFLVTSNREIFEGDAQGRVLWRAKVPSGVQDPHAWKAEQQADGRILVAGGYAATLNWFSADGVFIESHSTPEWTRPFFFCDFRVLPGERILLTNWQGHGESMGGLGVQVLLLSFKGELLWHWKQDAACISSLQATILAPE